MKKILLASTILVGTAGFAAADNANFTFSGEAATGFAYNLTTGAGTPTISAEFTAGMMTMTDGGLEAGASITISAGGFEMNTDHTSGGFGTFAPSITSNQATGISDAEVYISGDWGKLTVAYDHGGLWTVTTGDEMSYTYENTWGDFTLEASYTMGWNPGDDSASIQGTYSFGDYEVYAALNMDEVGGWGLDNVDFGGSAEMSGFSLAVDANYDLVTTLLTWKATAGYTTGPYSVEVFVEDDD
ncbi:MAG TPA: porin, partial [Rhodobacterales bacterium]|nr:porin [Rhodobacterales bacterium]